MEKGQRIYWKIYFKKQVYKRQMSLFTLQIVQNFRQAIGDALITLMFQQPTLIYIFLVAYIILNTQCSDSLDTTFYFSKKKKKNHSCSKKNIQRSNFWVGAKFAKQHLFRKILDKMHMFELIQLVGLFLELEFVKLKF